VCCAWCVADGTADGPECVVNAELRPGCRGWAQPQRRATAAREDGARGTSRGTAVGAVLLLPVLEVCLRG
jgi:hypothetical protein